MTPRTDHEDAAALLADLARSLRELRLSCAQVVRRHGRDAAPAFAERTEYLLDEADRAQAMLKALNRAGWLCADDAETGRDTVAWDDNGRLCQRRMW